jgi:hypothetical protein
MKKHMDKKQGRIKRVASDEEITAEKWLVAYRNPHSKKHPGGSVIVRQFYAPGYYEAYDMVLTQAEKMNLEVLWFREKRSCEPFLNRDFPELEILCTYCNKKFSYAKAVPCLHDACRGEFCSRKCMLDHCMLRHASPPE